MNRIELMKWCLIEVAKGHKKTKIKTFNQREQADLAPGVYILWNRANGHLEYIGQAKNIGLRLNPVHHTYYDPSRHMIGLISVKNDDLRYEIEQVLIFCFAPILNKQIPMDIWKGAEIDRLIEQVRLKVAYQLSLLFT